VNLTAADVADRIARLRSLRGGDRLVGIRHLTQSEPDAGYLDRADVRRGVAAVGSAGLVFDLVIPHPDMLRIGDRATVSAIY
jgi:predicted TIM-barrel fold metal-dependent hydrolase